MHTISNLQKEQNMDCLTNENNFTCKQKQKKRKENIHRKEKQNTVAKLQRTQMEEKIKEYSITERTQRHHKHEKHYNLISTYE